MPARQWIPTTTTFARSEWEVSPGLSSRRLRSASTPVPRGGAGRPPAATPAHLTDSARARSPISSSIATAAGTITSDGISGVYAVCPWRMPR